MPETITPNMDLSLPVIGQSLDPTWAQDINDAFTIVDTHDHTASKGVQIPTAGIDINADLNINQYNLTNLRSVKFRNGVAVLPTNDIDAIYVDNGNLYYNNSSGTAIQITNNGALNIGALAVNVFDTNTINTNIVIAPSDTFTLILVDTSITAKTINLPLASAISPGRYYLIKDASSNASVNNITIVLNGSDTIDNLSSNKTISANNGNIWLISNGVASWYSIGTTEATNTVAGIVKLAGDLSGTSALPRVTKINGASVPASGALVTGNLLTVIGAASLGYAALDAISLTSSTSLTTLNSVVKIASGLDLHITNVNGTYSVGTTELVLLVDTVTNAPAIINLPDETTRARVLFIKDTVGGANGNPIQLVPHTGKTIDGIATVSQLLSANYGFWVYCCDGNNNWFLIA